MYGFAPINNNTVNPTQFLFPNPMVTPGPYLPPYLMPSLPPLLPMPPVLYQTPPPILTDPNSSYELPPLPPTATRQWVR